MKKNIKTYVDIEELSINDNVGDQICYSVTFINQYDLEKSIYLAYDRIALKCLTEYLVSSVWKRFHK